MQSCRQTLTRVDRDERWDRVRSEFDLDPDFVHLALSMLTAHPRPVREAIERHRRGLDTNPALYFRNRDELNATVLTKAARYLGACPDSIALTESTTMGLAVVCTGLMIDPDHEILGTEHEHYAAWELLRRKATASGASHRRIRLYEDPRTATEEEIVTTVAANLRDNTRLLMLTWVHSGTGVKLPLSRISAVVTQANRGRPESRQIIICVDAIHAMGVEDFEVADLGCDFLVTGCHKWLFGPRGTGLVWGSDRGWAAVEPIATSFDVEVFWPWYQGFDPDLRAPKARLCTPGGFPAFEHRWALGEAFDFHLAIGKAQVNQRISDLNAYLQAQLSSVIDVLVRTPRVSALSSGMVCLDVPGMDPADVVEELLADRVIAGQTPYRNSAVRFAPGVLNSVDDIDQAVASLTRIAGKSRVGRRP